MVLRPLFTSSIFVGCRILGVKSVPTPFACGVVRGNVLWSNNVNANKNLQAQVIHRSFATDTTTNPGVSKLDSGDIQTLVERDHFVKIKKRLEKDTRRRITLQEYQTIAKEEGLSEDSALRLLRSLSDSGFVLYFSNSTNSNLQNSVFLKPQEINTAIHTLLDHYSPAALKLQAEAIQTEIKEIITQLEPLKQQRDHLDHKAHRRANTIVVAGLGYCVLQFLAIGRLTWWELSWDVMEPVTYMLTFATALIGYSFFVATGSEYTFEGLKRTLRERRLKKLIQKTGFDEAKFKQLHKALQVKEEHLLKVLDEIAHAGPAINTPPLHIPPSDATPAATSV